MNSKCDLSFFSFDTKRKQRFFLNNTMTIGKVVATGLKKLDASMAKSA